MKTNRLLLMGIVLLVALAFVGVASACEYGCTPGYWKNHPEVWEGITFVPGFDYPEIDLNSDPGFDTPLEMLSYHGGPGIDGAKRILLRAYIASFLNHEMFAQFPFDMAEVQTAYNSGDRQTMIDLAAELDSLNNGVCEFTG